MVKANLEMMAVKQQSDPSFRTEKYGLIFVHSKNLFLIRKYKLFYRTQGVFFPAGSDNIESIMDTGKETRGAPLAVKYMVINGDIFGHGTVDDDIEVMQQFYFGFPVVRVVAPVEGESEEPLVLDGMVYQMDAGVRIGDRRFQSEVRVILKSHSGHPGFEGAIRVRVSDKRGSNGPLTVTHGVTEEKNNNGEDQFTDIGNEEVEPEDRILKRGNPKVPSIGDVFPDKQGGVLLQVINFDGNNTGVDARGSANSKEVSHDRKSQRKVKIERFQLKPR